MTTEKVNQWIEVATLVAITCILALLITINYVIWLDIFISFAVAGVLIANLDGKNRCEVPAWLIILYGVVAGIIFLYIKAVPKLTPQYYVYFILAAFLSILVGFLLTWLSPIAWMNSIPAGILSTAIVWQYIIKANPASLVYSGISFIFSLSLLLTAKLLSTTEDKKADKSA